MKLSQKVHNHDNTNWFRGKLTTVPIYDDLGSTMKAAKAVKLRFKKQPYFSCPLSSLCLLFLCSYCFPTSPYLSFLLCLSRIVKSDQNCPKYPIGQPCRSRTVLPTSSKGHSLSDKVTYLSCCWADGSKLIFSYCSVCVNVFSTCCSYLSYTVKQITCAWWSCWNICLCNLERCSLFRPQTYFVIVFVITKKINR